MKETSKRENKKLFWETWAFFVICVYIVMLAILIGLNIAYLMPIKEHLCFFTVSISVLVFYTSLLIAFLKFKKLFNSLLNYFGFLFEWPEN